MMKAIGKVIFNYKAVLIVFSLILMSASSLAVAEHKSNIDQLSMTYSFDQPIITTVEIENMVFDEVIIPGVLSAGNPGEPCLPIKGSYILLPQGKTVEKITLQTPDMVTLGCNYYVKPVGDIVPISQKTTVSPPTPDETIYSSDEVYPGTLYNEVDIYSFRGYQILVLELYPVHYIPLSGELLYYGEITVTLDLKKDETIHPLYRGLEKDKVEVLQKIDNPETITTYTQSNINTGDSYDLLILTTDALQEGFELLQNAHDYEGLSTVIKTLTDVGGSSTEDIRDYIRDAYTDWGIDYVLIGGDDGVIPARILWVYGLDEGTTPYDTYMPSDLYYGCLDGPYNYDGDNKWGEPTDGEGGGDVDLMAEVYVGRACVDNAADVTNFVTKTVAYLTEDAEDPYLKEYCLAGEYMGDYGIATWGGNYMDQLIDSCNDDGYSTVGIPSDEYTITTLYDRDWPGNNWNKYDVMDIINNGIHTINHLGHSSYGYNMKMDYEDVYGLTNEKYCFIYSQGCMAGGFDNPQGYDSIAEHFTVKTQNAAYAVIMNARYGWFWSYSTDGDSQRFQREFWDAVFGEDIPEIGRANQDSKEDNLYIIERSCIRWCYYQLNLFGDPSLAFVKDPHANPDLEIGDVTGGFGLEAMIKNTGDADATDVDWTITVTGGMFDLINKTFSGTVSELVVDEEVTVNTNMFLGLGKINITITAECNEGSFADETVEGTQFFLLTKIP